MLTQQWAFLSSVFMAHLLRLSTLVADFTMNCAQLL
jgi:hypothetical protein